MARNYVGTIENKDYYWNDDKTGHLEWRVPDIREAIQSRPGYKILAADYSQVEVKIMGFLSGDKDLIAAINSGKDIHSYIAAEIFGAKYNFDYELISAAKENKNHPRHKELTSIRANTKSVVFGTPLHNSIVAI